MASSPVIFRDRAFLIQRPIQCLDLATGKLKWRGGDFTNGSCLVTAADGKLIVFGSRKLVLLDALAEAAPLLARGDDSGFMNKVALLSRDPEEEARRAARKAAAHSARSAGSRPPWTIANRA